MIKKSKIFKYSMIALSMVFASNFIMKASAANSYIPDLNIYQNGSSPKVEIGIEVANPTKFWGNTSNVTPNLNWAGDGGQSIQTIDGFKAIHSPDTYTNLTGNFYSYPAVKTNSNYLDFGRITSPNGKWFSMSAKVKCTGSNNNFRLSAYPGHACKGVPFTDNNGHILKFKDNYNYSSKQDLYVYTDQGTISLDNGATYIFVTSHDTNWGYHYVYFTWSQSEQKLINTGVVGDGDAFDYTGRTAPRYDDFARGEQVLHIDWATAGGGDFSFDERQIPNDGQWHTISLNSLCRYNLEYYDPNKAGFKPGIRWGSNGDFYVTDVKFGDASRVQVFRDADNFTNLIYDDYGSEFIDTGLVIKPNTPTITYLDTLENSISLQFNATEKNEQHYYTTRSLNSNGEWSALSNKKYVTLTSTPSKYHIKLYKNNSLVKDEDTTNNSISYGDVKRGDRITGSIQTIDTNGQWSDPISINYIVKQTLKDYKKDVKQLEDDSNKVAKSYSYAERETIKGKINKTANDLRTNPNLNRHKAVTTIDDEALKDTETEFESGRKIVNIYIN